MTGARRSRGFALLECVVAMIVMSIGALAIGKLQLASLAEADSSRQRDEAMLLAQQKLEQLRWDYRVSGGAVASSARSDVPPLDSNTRFDRAWTLTAIHQAAPADTTVPPPPSATGPSGGSSPAAPGARTTLALSLAVVDVAWTSRRGDTDRVRVISLLAPSDPADAARLRLQAIADAARRGATRHAEVPPLAVDLGDGTSVLRVGLDARRYDNASGRLVSLCRFAAMAAAASNCAPAPWPAIGQ